MGDMADYYIEQGIGHDDFDSDFDGEQTIKRMYTRYGSLAGPGPCPRCKAKTILRNGIYGEFYGCTKFPKCKGTRDI